MNQVIIEPFRNEYTDAVVALIASSFSSKFANMLSLSFSHTVSLLKETWDLSETNPDSGHFVAKVNGSIVGVILLKYAAQKREENKQPHLTHLLQKYGCKNVLKYTLAMYLFDHDLLEKECYIEHVAVNADYRGMGIGTLLLDHAKGFAKTLSNISVLSLSVAESNVKAYKLYEHHNFKEVIKHRMTSYLLGWLVKEQNWRYMVCALK